MERKKLKIAALITSLVLSLVILFSVFFIAKEADHTCTGHDCPVCACLHEVQENLNLFGSGLSTVALSPTLALFFLGTSSLALGDKLFRSTLVSQKVRMNN